MIRTADLPCSVDPAHRHDVDAAGFLASAAGRLLILDVGIEGPGERLLREVGQGLAARKQKWIPPTYFYDDHGSQLFEAITTLSEYYLTRSEQTILQRIEPELARRLQPEQIVELGSGSATKTRLLFDAFAARKRALSYIPIDVSRAVLETSAERLLQDYPRMKILGLVGQYEDALAALPWAGNRLILFLGGTIGNFTPTLQEQFFTLLAARLESGDHLLLGYDRSPHPAKPARFIFEAYNDAAGVTAAFNLNLLTRLNRELGADFRLGDWTHRAIYNAGEQQIEMYLDCQAGQTVTIPALERRYHFAPGESILTEISRKFDPEDLAAWFARLGLRPVAHWTDQAELFGLMLLVYEDRRRTEP